MKHLLFQITPRGARVFGSETDFKKAKREFDRTHCILLKNFIEPDLLGTILGHVSRAKFYEKRDEGIALEDCMRQNAAYNILQFLADDWDLLRAVCRVTGCGAIEHFDGRVYRFTPGTGHYDSWHSDVDERRPRLVGMGVNLSPERYLGGVFQIREKKTGRITQEVHNSGLGDATLFRISPLLHHRVTPLLGQRSRTAFAGWFKSKAANLHIANKGRAAGPKRSECSLSSF